MSTGLLEHNGYQGSVEFSSEDSILFGKILFIDSLIMYHGESVAELKDAFKIAVDSYLEHCKRNGKEPNRPYSGSFNVRVGPELHKAAVQRAYLNKQTLNEFVKKAIESAIISKDHQHSEMTINHVITHEHVVSTYSTEEKAWQPLASGRPQLRVVPQ